MKTRKIMKEKLTLFLKHSSTLARISGIIYRNAIIMRLMEEMMVVKTGQYESDMKAGQDQLRKVLEGMKDDTKK